MPGSLRVETEEARVPNRFITILILLTISPFLLNIFGISFRIQPPFTSFESFRELGSIRNETELLGLLKASFIHTVLEWSAVGHALFTVLIALVHFKIKRDMATPIIALAFLCSGIVDIFHVLAHNRIIPTAAGYDVFAGFSWTASRMINALILILGATFFIVTRFRIKQKNLFFILLINLFFGILTLLGIYHFTTVSAIPQMLFPDALVKRPYELMPLVLYLFAGLYLLKHFYKLSPNFFAHALIISIIPQVAVQLHMAFGSAAIYDNHYNIAHFLKATAYFVPFGGLVLDYVKTYHQEKVAIEKLENTRQNLEERTREVEKANRELQREIIDRKRAEEKQVQLFQELERTNKELKNFAYIVSHDLKAPLRAISSLASWISSDYADKFDKEGKEQMNLLIGRAKRMHNLIEGILQFSRIGYLKEEKTVIDLNQMIPEIWSLLGAPSNIQIKIINELPVINFERTHISQIFQNLLSNAIKFMDKTDGCVQIYSTDQVNFWHFIVEDNGPGIDEGHFDRIFQIFQTLKPRDEVESTGIGLSIVKKIIEFYGGQIWVESKLNKGSSFHFTLPKTHVPNFFQGE